MPDRHKPGYMKDYNESRRQESIEYQKANYRQLNIRLSVTADADVIDRIDHSGEPVAAYIRRLVRKDISENPS